MRVPGARADRHRGRGERLPQDGRCLRTVVGILYILMHYSSKRPYFNALFFQTPLF